MFEANNKVIFVAALKWKKKILFEWQKIRREVKNGMKGSLKNF